MPIHVIDRLSGRRYSRGWEKRWFQIPISFFSRPDGRLNSSRPLPVVVGWVRTKELLYTSRLVEAEEAAWIGLLNKVVAADQLLEAAVEMGRQIAKNVPECVQAAKLLLNEDLGRSWQAMYQAEQDTMATELKPSPLR